MKLIYRALEIEYTPAPVPAYRPPYALNWRFQTTEYAPAPRTAPKYQSPRALNWRFRMATAG